MLKRILTFAIISMVFGFYCYSQTLEEIMDMNLKARGGSEKLSDMKTYQFEAKMSMMGMEVPMKYFSEKPDKMRMEMSMMGMDQIMVINKDKGWQKQGGSVSEIPADQMEKIKTGMKSQGDYKNYFLNYKENGYKIEFLGKEKVDEVTAYKIKIETKDKDVIFLYIDAKTNLEYKMTSKTPAMGGEMIDTEIFFKNNKEVKGVLIPHLMEIKAQGQIITMTLFNIKVNEPIDPKKFEKPE
jgi:outer membrane lipoprotein-sorting protein